MKSCRTLNRQTVVDCDNPPLPDRPLPIWPKSSADLWGGGRGVRNPPPWNLWSNKKTNIN